MQHAPSASVLPVSWKRRAPSLATPLSRGTTGTRTRANGKVRSSFRKLSAPPPLTCLCSQTYTEVESCGARRPLACADASCLAPAVSRATPCRSPHASRWKRKKCKTSLPKTTHSRAGNRTVPSVRPAVFAAARRRRDVGPWLGHGVRVALHVAQFCVRAGTNSQGAWKHHLCGLSSRRCEARSLHVPHRFWLCLVRLFV